MTEKENQKYGVWIMLGMGLAFYIVLAIVMAANGLCGVAKFDQLKPTHSGTMLRPRNLAITAYYEIDTSKTPDCSTFYYADGRIRSSCNTVTRIENDTVWVGDTTTDTVVNLLIQIPSGRRGGIRYNGNDSTWEYSNDGTTWQDMGSGGWNLADSADEIKDWIHDTADLALRLTGGTMSGNIEMGDNDITDIGEIEAQNLVTFGADTSSELNLGLSRIGAFVKDSVEDDSTEHQVGIGSYLHVRGGSHSLANAKRAYGGYFQSYVFPDSGDTINWIIGMTAVSRFDGDGHAQGINGAQFIGKTGTTAGNTGTIGRMMGVVGSTQLNDSTQVDTAVSVSAEAPIITAGAKGTIAFGTSLKAVMPSHDSILTKMALEIRSDKSDDEQDLKIGFGDSAANYHYFSWNDADDYFHMTSPLDMDNNNIKDVDSLLADAVYTDTIGIHGDKITDIRGDIHDTADVVRGEMGDSINARMTKAATGNTETGITVTYQSGDSTIDYEVDVSVSDSSSKYSDSSGWTKRIKETAAGDSLYMDGDSLKYSGSNPLFLGTAGWTGFNTGIILSDDSINDFNGDGLEVGSNVLQVTSDIRNHTLDSGEVAIIVSDSGFTKNTGDITGVTAGNGLTDGGASGDVTLNVGAGTGITVNANDVEATLGTSITSDEITNGTIDSIDMAANSIRGYHIQANTVDSTDIAPMGASSGKVLKYDGSNWVPKDDSVGVASDAGDFNLYGQLGRNNYKEAIDTSQIFCDNGENWDRLGNYAYDDTAHGGGLTDTFYCGVHPSALYVPGGYGCEKGDSIYAYDTSASPDTLVAAWAIEEAKWPYLIAWTPLPVIPYENATIKVSKTGKYNDWQRACVSCTTSAGDTVSLCIKDPVTEVTDMNYWYKRYDSDFPYYDTVVQVIFGMTSQDASADPDLFIDKNNRLYVFYTANASRDSIYSVTNDTEDTSYESYSSNTSRYICAAHSNNLFNWDNDSLFYSYHASGGTPLSPMVEQGDGDTVLMFLIYDATTSDTSNYLIRYAATTLFGDSVFTLTDTCIINNYYSDTAKGLWHGDILKLGREYHCIASCKGSDLVDYSLKHLASYDGGVTWDMTGRVLLEPGMTPAAWDSGGNLYRPTFIAENSGDGLRFRMWYSALRGGGSDHEYHMGQTYVTFDRNKRIKTAEAMIWNPDLITDTIPIFYVDSNEFPRGIKILGAELQTSEDGAYAFNLYEFTGADPPVLERHIDTLNIGASDQRAQSELFTDDEIEKGKIIYINTPDTDIDWIRFSIRYYGKTLCE